MVDYQKFTTRATSKERRKELNIGDIWANQAKCLSCEEVIRSKNKHDFATCGCGKLSVDGGSWYLKRCGDLTLCEEQSVLYDEV